MSMLCQAHTLSEQTMIERMLLNSSSVAACPLVACAQRETHQEHGNASLTSDSWLLARFHCHKPVQSLLRILAPNEICEISH